jgi:MFS family permease
MGPCFLVNAASFLPVTLALLFMNRDELRPTAQAASSRGQVREGFRYALSMPVIKTLLIMMAVVGTIEYNFQVILPVLAKETFHGDPKTLGILGAILGIGMFTGSLTNAAFGRPARKLLLLSGVSLGLFTLLAAAAPPLWLVALMMVPLGASSMAFLANMNSTLQLTSSDEMRGRVMAIYFVLFLGSTPIGAPIIGWLSEAFSPRVALGVGGIATLLAMGYGFWKLPALQLHSGDGDPVREAALQEAG